MAGLIVLAGGEEFRPGCEEMDLHLLQATGAERARVLVIPTAAALENPSLAASNGVDYFSRLGAEATSLMVLDRTHANDEALTRAVLEAHVVYFTGGNPAYLLATLQGSLLLQRLQEALAKGAVVGGSSAGAMVMGSIMRDPPAQTWVQGVAIAEGVAVLPHHERSDPRTVAETLAQAGLPDGLRVLGIDAKTACLGRPGSWRVVGSGKVTLYHQGRWAVFSAGEEIPYDL